jgi:hypothetical protein
MRRPGDVRQDLARRVQGKAQESRGLHFSTFFRTTGKLSVGWWTAFDCGLLLARRQ